MLDTKNNNDVFANDDQLATEKLTENETKTKPHIIRRNIEDYLEQRKLEKRLKDVFDDDFLID